jgi:integrase
MIRRRSTTRCTRPHEVRSRRSLHVARRHRRRETRAKGRAFAPRRTRSVPDGDFRGVGAGELDTTYGRESGAARARLRKDALMNTNGQVRGPTAARRAARTLRNSSYFIIVLPVSGAVTRLLPVLILDGTVCTDQVEFATFLADRKGRSPSTIRSATKAIALFADFLRFADVEGDNGEPDLLEALVRFAAVRQRGTAERDGTDPTGLGWPACRPDTARADVLYLSWFWDFLAEKYDREPVNPEIERQMTSFERRSDARRRWAGDPLFHLYRTTRRGRGIAKERLFQVRPGAPRGEGVTVRFFIEEVERIITRSPSVRDRTLWYLLAYGGIRLSEALNLFVDDVVLGPEGATVILKHPARGVDERFNSSLGRHAAVTRKSFLAAWAGLAPRNELPKSDPHYAGWKGMAWDDPAAEASLVHWLTPEHGKYFARMHERYMHVRGAARARHPYYFVATNDGNFGAPLKAANARRQFAAACERAGIPKARGAGRVHGLRHFYALVSVAVGRMALADLSRRMHHIDFGSTAKYGRETPEEMNVRLAAAFERINTAAPLRRGEEHL